MKGKKVFCRSINTVVTLAKGFPGCLTIFDVLRLLDIANDEKEWSIWKHRAAGEYIRNTNSTTVVSREALHISKHSGFG